MKERTRSSDIPLSRSPFPPRSLSICSQLLLHFVTPFVPVSQKASNNRRCLVRPIDYMICIHVVHPLLSLSITFLFFLLPIFSFGCLLILFVCILLRSVFVVGPIASIRLVVSLVIGCWRSLLYICVSAPRRYSSFLLSIGCCWGSASFHSGNFLPSKS